MRRTLFIITSFAIASVFAPPPQRSSSGLTSPTRSTSRRNPNDVALFKEAARAKADYQLQGFKYSEECTEGTVVQLQSLPSEVKPTQMLGPNCDLKPWVYVQKYKHTWQTTSLGGCIPRFSPDPDSRGRNGDFLETLNDEIVLCYIAEGQLLRPAPIWM